MKTIYASQYKVGDAFTRTMRVTISETHRGEYATHLQAQDLGDKFWGHYFSGPEAIVDAHEDFDKRVKELGVDPSMSNFVREEVA